MTPETWYRIGRWSWEKDGIYSFEAVGYSATRVYYLTGELVGPKGNPEKRWHPREHCFQTYAEARSALIKRKALLVEEARKVLGEAETKLRVARALPLHDPNRAKEAANG